MEFTKAKQSFRALKSKINSQNFVMGCLAFAIACLAYDVGVKGKMSIMTPMNLAEKAEVGYSSASASYYKPIAFQLVSMVSSITPETADYWHQVLEPFYDPEIWAWLGPQILQIKTRPQITALSTYSFFRPNEKTIEYEPDTGTIFISGKVTSSAFNKGSEQMLASVDSTFEVKMHMVNGIPMVRAWRAYTGQPMTKKWIQKNPGLAEKREEEIRQQAALVLPKPKAQDIIYEDAPATTVIPAPASVESSPAVAAGMITPESAQPTASQIQQGILPPVEGGVIPETQQIDDRL